MEQHYVHIDSKNRDTRLFPDGNSYVLHLPVPIKAVTRVDLVSAKVPNSMYNVTNGSNVITTSYGNVSVSTGFYSAQGIVDAFGGCIQYLPSEGKFVYLSSLSTDFIRVNSDEFSKLLGLDKDLTYTVNLLDQPLCDYPYGIKSERVVDLSLNEYVFLDIEEFRTPYFSDAKSMPISGINARSMFAAIPMDVSSSQIKTFKENTDYHMSMIVPRQDLSRLTIHWYDKNLRPLDFQGYDNNSFILRIHTEMIKDHEKPSFVLEEEYEIAKKVRDEVFREQKKPEKTSMFGKWFIFLLVIGILGYFYILKK